VLTPRRSDSQKQDQFHIPHWRANSVAAAIGVTPGGELCRSGRQVDRIGERRNC
jgi:hypothetical protein